MKNTLIKILAIVSYIAMVFVNFLANALPINNRSTGQISEAYPNLFAPAGFAFSIWGLIYLLLAIYLVYQFIYLNKKENKKKEEFFKKINLVFILTCIANLLWIFSWHYDFIGVSVLIMAVLLFSLLKISNLIQGEKILPKEKRFISIPFNVYLGWITVATIANITVFLVSVGWKGFGISDFIWTSVVLVVGAIIGILRINKTKNISYCLVFIWAYFWILFKHISSSGFNGNYPSIIVTASICIFLFALALLRIVYNRLVEKIE